MSPDMPAVASPPGPLLRTLAPALRNLEKKLRDWLDAPHPRPIRPIIRFAGIAMLTSLSATTSL